MFKPDAQGRYHLRHPSQPLIVTVYGWLARILLRHGYEMVEVESEEPATNDDQEKSNRETH